MTVKTAGDRFYNALWRSMAILRSFEMVAGEAYFSNRRHVSVRKK